jgi:hypothetical protein
LVTPRVYRYVDNLADWRTMLNYPPKQTELWIASQKLLLYGEEADEDEQRAVENANKMLAGLPVTVRSHEERLMLAGAASDKDEASLILSGKASEEDLQVMADGTMRPAGLPAVQLYAAAEPEEEDDQVERAMNALADGVYRLEQAVASDHVEEAVLKVINRTKDFYLNGVRPLRGLDEVRVRDEKERVWGSGGERERAGEGAGGRRRKRGGRGSTERLLCSRMRCDTHCVSSSSLVFSFHRTLP